ncbi:alpha/beta hydrolase [Iningainema tapete]|uniref:Alpha/beta hydrolase n=1 Tax=Iningainema tapete BLCC-T55 TaxID=2748662 RepID=A0A8J7BZG0_9CYAN|nr:alpha/beta hydrolase [Iningainema tapete]MBD2777587.1 alpha/beta hydrolase [Iningainema tapete BLCC-T55]
MARHKNQTGFDSKVLPGVTQHQPCDRSTSNLLKGSRTRKQHKLQTVLGAFTFGVLSNLVITTPGLGAEQIAFYYPPFGEFTLSTRSLEIFAKEGKITSEFGFYAKRIKPEQLAQLRELLGKRFEVTPTLVSQFTYSRIGENLLQRMGELLKTEKSQNGFYALRGALILSAATPEGLTLVNVIRRYPSRSIRLNLGGTQEIIGNLADLLKRRDAVVFIVKQTAEAEAANSPKIDFSQQPDLRRAGSFRWQKKNIEMDDRARERRFAVDLYLPQTQTPSSGFPLIVISHGVAENRETFAYVAQHLTSYGFAAAVLEHPGSDAKRFQQYFSGLAGPPEANELINRPLDVKFVLDELQRLSSEDPTIKGQLNLQQVGALGHSLGGYTALALAGASIDFQQVRKDCYPNRSLNLSVFLQCRAGELPPGSYPIQDPRIKAVMAINPLNSTILGQKGISQIQVPVMLVGGSQDIVTPAVPEQIRPFTWLSTRNKYLVLMENGTHFSTLDKLDTGENVLPVPPSLIGPDPAIARPYVNALSLAFFQTHLLNRQEYRPYLSASYAQFISKSPLNLSLVQSFSAEMLAPIYDGTYQQSAQGTR